MGVAPSYGWSKNIWEKPIEMEDEQGTLSGSPILGTPHLGMGEKWAMDGENTMKIHGEHEKLDLNLW